MSNIHSLSSTSASPASSSVTTSTTPINNPIMNSKKIGFWWSEKKSVKLNPIEFKKILHDRCGFQLVKIDLESPLETQGPFRAIVHKLSDVAAKADSGDLKAKQQLDSFEEYVAHNPDVVVIDYMEGVRILIDRYKQYKLVEESDLAKEDLVFTPSFTELTSTCVEENMKKLKAAGVKFPFVCKPLMAHGSTFAHQMSLIFCEKGLEDIQPPCVAQTFINHDARLFKLFVIKDKYRVIERPSLKNFKPGDYPTVHFDSHDISKPDSSSYLNQLDDDEMSGILSDGDKMMSEPRKETLDVIVKEVRTKLGLTLFGIDVIIEKGTGRYAIIDMNVFPGYDGVDNFFEELTDLLLEEIKEKDEKMKIYHQQQQLKKSSNQVVVSKSSTSTGINGHNAADIDSGIDTSDSCDEKKPLSVKKAEAERMRGKHFKQFSSLSSSSITSSSVPVVNSSCSNT